MAFSQEPVYFLKINAQYNTFILRNMYNIFTLLTTTMNKLIWLTDIATMYIMEIDINFHNPTPDL